MPPKPQYIHELTASVGLLDEQVSNLRTEWTKLQTKHEDVKDIVDETRRDVAVIKQKISELSKRTEIWDRRMWGLVVVLIGALLSLASGLIVSLALR